MVPRPTFFPDPARLRAWLKAHHDSADVLWVGFYKRSSGKPSVTYHEALDEALCFGWIDGVRKSVAADAYTIRFTPRRARSRWSRVNIARANALVAAGRMHASGRARFDARGDVVSGRDGEGQPLAPAYRRLLRADPSAWAFYSAQPPSYRRLTTHWVMSAKKEETRRRRLATLIACSAKHERIPQLAAPAKK